MLERKDEEVWDILEEVIRNHPVLLNRAPTLHRMGIQAFEPVLVEGNAMIKLHPLVCKGFNADFDGDQMAVHLPLSIEAQVEAHTLMMSTNNIFSPSNGAPIISPSQDVVMGCYYITMSLPPGRKGEGMVFSSLDEVQLAYSLGALDTHARSRVKLPPGRTHKANDAKPGALNETTVGRVIFNMTLPDGMPYYNIPMRSSELAKVISDCYQILGRRATIDLLDDMNRLGFRQSTYSGLSFATDDLITPPSKGRIINDAERDVLKKNKLYQPRYHHRRRTLQPGARPLDPRSRTHHHRNDDRVGERPSLPRLRQPDLPHGPLRCPRRRGTDPPVGRHARFDGQAVGQDHRNADQGQLPRRIVRARVLQLDPRCPQGFGRYGLEDGRLGLLDPQVGRRGSQNVVITQEDCGTTQGITKGVIYRGEKVEVRLADSIRGRVSRTNIVNPITDEVIVREHELITIDIGRKIEDMGLEKIQVRSPMTCDATLGICRRCYGMDLSTGSLVEEGMAVGIIAAQSIGEPGTQLTMRTFHIGGTAARAVEEKDIRAKKGGIAKFTRLKVVRQRRRSASGAHPQR